MSKFKVQISIRRAEDDGAVFRKHDGERFESATTVKLNVATKYNVLVTTRPALGVKKVLVKGEPLSLEIQKREKPDEKVCVYHADWSTDGYDVSKSNERKILPIVVEMEDGATISPSLQVKFYPLKEISHSKWGQEFHLLDVDCQRQEGTSLLDVQERYI